MNWMRLVFSTTGLFAVTFASAAEDPLPQQSSSGEPSSQSVPTTTTDQPGDITLTPENPVPNNPLPPIPKLELNTSQEYAPVLPALNQSEQSGLYGPQIYVKQFEFTGNTVYDSATLAKLLDKYTGRKITGEELESARQILTLYYVDHGYINSGAVLPDQDPKDGIVHFQIVEGKLTLVLITGNNWFQTWWLRNEMRFAAGEPLNFNSLKEGMQVLRENPNDLAGQRGVTAGWRAGPEPAQDGSEGLDSVPLQRGSEQLSPAERRRDDCAGALVRPEFDWQ